MSGPKVEQEIEEPTDRELLEYLGLDKDEIETALTENEMNIGFNLDSEIDVDYPSRTSKEPTPNQVNSYLTQNYYPDKKESSGQKSLYNGYVSRCVKHHDGSEYIWKSEEKTIGGAKGSALDGKYPALVIDLAGAYQSRVDQMKRSARDSDNFVRSGPERLLGLRNFVVKQPVEPVPEILRLDWTDMGIPPVGLRFWNELWDLLPQGHTVFCCVGGHGRTGTALAAMILVSSKMSAEEATELVRKLHCKEAIESLSQEKYLEELARARNSRVRKKGAK